MRFPKRRREWLLGRWTAKYLAVQVVPMMQSLEPYEFSILNHPQGAPFFASSEGTLIPAALSISHRDDKALCATSTLPNLFLGVDLERIEPRSSGFVTDYFTENEQNFVRSLPSYCQDAWVTAAWSLKESVLKALGLGLRVDTRQVEIRQFMRADDFDPSPREWEEVEALTQELGDLVFRGYWRRRGGYVLTLVWGNASHGQGNVQPKMHEVNLGSL
jgi:4'-phosphopantetheinyl transferase